MPRKTIKDLRALSKPELQDKIKALKDKLIDLKFKASVGRLEKPSDIRNSKRDIARIITILKEAK